MQISNSMVSVAYDIGKLVYSCKVGRLEGSIEICRRTGMNSGSASDYITVLLAMLKGECYKRTINQYATKHYLENIGTDFGTEAQKVAAKTTLAHVEYYKSIHGYLKGIEKIAKQYI